MALISGEGRRIILWMCWCCNMIFTTIYYVLSFATTANLVRSYKMLDIDVSNEIWRAPVAASCLGGLLVLLFNILSCAILVKKSVQKGGPGFGYGFVCAFCFTLAFFCLLCGLVLDGFKDTVKDHLEVKLAGTWTNVNTGTYLGTIAFAYLSFVMFILFFLGLVMFQSAVNEELGLPAGGQAFNPYAKMQGQQDNPYAVSVALDNPAGSQQPLAMKTPIGPSLGGAANEVLAAARLSQDPTGAL